MNSHDIKLFQMTRQVNRVIRLLNEQTNHRLVLVCEDVTEHPNPVTEDKTCPQ